ncbi:MAG: helix-turn-helix transcriptional regulator, partial [Clostridia bacterium]|nr:helix-turn-helix transcriptional regulator [Clostridia bacterium]
MKTRDIITRIGYIRNKANLSARELSERIGMSPQYISQLENGRITLSVEKLLSILEACEYPIEKF